MKVAIWSAVIAAMLILFCAAAYAKDGAASGEAADGYIFSLNRKSADTLYSMKEQRLKALEAKKAEESEKVGEKAKKAKIDKIQGKTGRTATSWQVLNG
jgi:hypothetical protein